MADLAVNIIIHGRVQGVFFRASAKEMALELCLKGWVRNMPDGTVEVHIEGSPDALNLFIEWCRKGPSMAKVLKCNLDWVTPQEISSFKIL